HRRRPLPQPPEREPRRRAADRREPRRRDDRPALPPDRPLRGPAGLHLLHRLRRRHPLARIPCHHGRAVVLLLKTTTMRKQDIAIPLLMGTLALLLATIPIWAHAQQQPGAKEQPGNEQVIIPQVDRRDVKLPRMPSKDFEVGLFAGVYATQNFGTHAVGGIRLGYHLSEDIFVEGVLAQTKVSDEPLRAVIPAGIFPEPTEKLTYYNL